MNKEIMIREGFQDKVMLLEVGQCPACGNKIYCHEFKDMISVREFTISGLCQKCQDKHFD